jgi:hypothetical protein
MKTNHENIQLIESALKNLQITSYEITDVLVKTIYHNYILPKYPNSIPNQTISSTIKLYNKQYSFIQRDLLKIKYKQNNLSAKGIKEGFVYAISNPAFPDYVKIGSSIDVYSRLDTYQTSSPYRDYELISYFFSYNRLDDEKQLINSYKHNGEWCKVAKDDIVDYIKLKKIENSPRVTKSEKELLIRNIFSSNVEICSCITPIASIMQYIKVCGFWLYEVEPNNIDYLKLRHELLDKQNWVCVSNSKNKVMFINNIHQLFGEVLLANNTISSVVVYRT